MIFLLPSCIGILMLERLSFVFLEMFSKNTLRGDKKKSYRNLKGDFYTVVPNITLKNQ